MCVCVRVFDVLLSPPDKSQNIPLITTHSSTESPTLSSHNRIVLPSQCCYYFDGALVDLSKKTSRKYKYSRTSFISTFLKKKSKWAVITEVRLYRLDPVTSAGFDKR